MYTSLSTVVVTLKKKISFLSIIRAILNRALIGTLFPLPPHNFVSLVLIRLTFRSGSSGAFCACWSLQGGRNDFLWQVKKLSQILNTCNLQFTLATFIKKIIFYHTFIGKVPIVVLPWELFLHISSRLQRLNAKYITYSHLLHLVYLNSKYLQSLDNLKVRNVFYFIVCWSIEIFLRHKDAFLKQELVNNFPIFLRN